MRSLLRHADALRAALRPASRPAAPPATPEAEARARARHLLSLLERGDLPPAGDAELRRMAADLVARVETARAGRPRPAAAPAERPARPLFTAPSAGIRGAASSGAAPTATVGTAAAGPSHRAVPAAPAASPGAGLPDIDLLLSAARAGGTLSGEHPAAIARALADSPRRAQAEALRALTPAAARVVHRLLVSEPTFLRA